MIFFATGFKRAEAFNMNIGNADHRFQQQFNGALPVFYNKLRVGFELHIVIMTETRF